MGLAAECSPQLMAMDGAPHDGMGWDGMGTRGTHLVSRPRRGGLEKAIELVVGVGGEVRPRRWWWWAALLRRGSRATQVVRRTRDHSGIEARGVRRSTGRCRGWWASRVVHTSRESSRQPSWAAATAVSMRWRRPARAARRKAAGAAVRTVGAAARARVPAAVRWRPSRWVVQCWPTRRSVRQNCGGSSPASGAVTKVHPPRGTTTTGSAGDPGRSRRLGVVDFELSSREHDALEVAVRPHGGVEVLELDVGEAGAFRAEANVGDVARARKDASHVRFDVARRPRGPHSEIPDEERPRGLFRARHRRVGRPRDRGSSRRPLLRRRWWWWSGGGGAQTWVLSRAPSARVESRLLLLTGSSGSSSSALVLVLLVEPGRLLRVTRVLRCGWRRSRKAEAQPGTARDGARGGAAPIGGGDRRLWRRPRRSRRNVPAAERVAVEGRGSFFGGRDDEPRRARLVLVVFDGT
mmetsp:Transcript_20105/g.80195  ORF Transcript_20105/g.80195 Transcript_20105/m.80195 type:complete len:465 (-) Transcript_20105:68-1462(-)